jgi:hypothetical protein
MLQIFQCASQNKCDSSADHTRTSRYVCTCIITRHQGLRTCILRGLAARMAWEPWSGDCAPVGSLCAHPCALLSPKNMRLPDHGISRRSSLYSNCLGNTRYLGRTFHRLTTSHHHYQIMEIYGSLVGACTVLEDRLLSLLRNSPPKRRVLIALAGVPGFGKSTIAATLLAHLDGVGMRDVVVAPMV